MSIVLRLDDQLHVARLTPEDGGVVVELDGVARRVEFVVTDQGGLALLVEGKSYPCDFDRKGSRLRIYVRGSVFETEVVDERQARRAVASGTLGEGGPQILAAPMPGKVVRILVKVGQTVQAGDGLVVVEAMKMENELRAARAGVVRELSAQEGMAVEGGTRLCVIE